MAPDMTVVLLVMTSLMLTGPVMSQHQLTDAERVPKIMKVADHVLRAHGGIRQVSITIYNGGSLTKNYNFNPSAGVVVENLASRPPHCVGDITQGLSAVLVQKLLVQNNYTWDQPIAEILGHTIVLPDLYRSEKLSLRDVFSMRSGLGGMDIVPVTRPYSGPQLQRKLRYLPEVSGFRSKYAHNDVLFTLVDAVVEKITGMVFEDAMQAHLLQPLGMDGAQFFWNATMNRPLSYSSIVKSASTLCITDYAMTQYFRFLTTEGYDSTNVRYLPTDKLNQLFQAVQPRGSGDQYVRGYKDSPEAMAFTLGQNALGWVVGRVGAHHAVSMGGSFVYNDQSLITYLPDRKIGVFVSFPGTGDDKDFAAKYLLTDRLLRLELTKYRSGAMIREAQTIDALNNMARFDPLSGDQVMLDEECMGMENEPCGVQRPLDEFEGTYRNYAFGDVRVTFNESGNLQLLMEYGDAVYELRSMRIANNTFSLKSMDGGYYTAWATLFRQPFTATFRAAQDDAENRIFSVTIFGFDRNVNPEFSLNPREPNYERREAKEDNADCSACGLVLSVWCIVLAVVSFRL